MPSLDFAFRSAINIGLKRDNAIKKVDIQLREEEEKGAFVLFTDGSAIPEIGVGAAAVTRHDTYRVSLGPEGSISNFEAEIMGVILAIIHSDNFTGIDRVAIFSDNQSALQVAHDQPRPRSGQHLALGIRNLVANLPPELSFHFYWSPGHEGIELNELADEAAKDAAEYGDEITILPISLGSLLKKIKEEFNICNVSFDPGRALLSPRPKEVSDALFSLEKGQASVIFQLRSGHCPLNAYLFRFKRHKTGLCNGCMVPETVEHFLLHCRRYNRHRAHFRKKASKARLKINLLSLKDLLDTPKLFVHLADFVLHTKRFPLFTTFLKEEKSE